MRSNRAVPWGVAACVVAAALALAGCGDDSDGSRSTSTSSGGGAAGVAALGASSWSLAASTSLGVPTDGVSVTAEFRDGRVFGSSGCNTYRGPFTASGSSLRIGPDLATTQIACAPGPTAVERAYLARLPKVRSYRMEGEALILEGSDGAALLVYDAVDGAAAIVGSWNATSFYTGNAVESPATGSTPTAVFDASNVSGNGGCNSFNGAYSVKGDGITIGPLASTMMACADPARQTQEQQYLAALEAAKTFTVTGASLQLFRPGGTIAAIFERAPAAG